MRGCACAKMMRTGQCLDARKMMTKTLNMKEVRRRERGKERGKERGIERRGETKIERENDEGNMNLAEVY